MWKEKKVNSNSFISFPVLANHSILKATFSVLLLTSLSSLKTYVVVCTLQDSVLKFGVRDSPSYSERILIKKPKQDFFKKTSDKKIL